MIQLHAITGETTYAVVDNVTWRITCRFGDARATWVHFGPGVVHVYLGLGLTSGDVAFPGGVIHVREVAGTGG